LMSSILQCGQVADSEKVNSSQGRSQGMPTYLPFLS